MPLGGTKTFGRLDSEEYVKLKGALSLDHERLVILHENGAFVENVFPRIEDFSTEEGVWVDKIRYSFSFVYDELASGNTHNIQSYSDDWNFSQPSDGNVQVTHSISAKIDLSPDDLSDKEKEDAIILSRQFCDGKSGLGNIPRSLFSSIHNYLKQYSSQTGQSLINSQLVQTNKNETSNIADGSYSLSETYELVSSVEQVQVAISVDEARIITATVSRRS